MWSSDRKCGFDAGPYGDSTDIYQQQMILYGQQAMVPLSQIPRSSMNLYHSAQQQAVHPNTTSQVHLLDLIQQGGQPQAPDFRHLKIAMPFNASSEIKKKQKYWPIQQPDQPYIAGFNDLKVSVASAAAIEAKRKQKTTTTVTKTKNKKQTKVYKGSDSGGQAHKKAAAKGEDERFERQVQEKIASLGVCDAFYEWYKCFSGGYLCGGGTHFICFDEIDKWAGESSHVLKVERVNTPLSAADNILDDGRAALLSVYPPQVDFWQPMHETHLIFEWSAYNGFAVLPEEDPLYRRAKFRIDRDTDADDSEACSCIEKLGLADVVRTFSAKITRTGRSKRFGGGRMDGFRDVPYSGMINGDVDDKWGGYPGIDGYGGGYGGGVDGSGF